MNDIEHPDITEANRTGYPHFIRNRGYYCPICGSRLFDNDRIYSKAGTIIGCSDCIERDTLQSAIDTELIYVEEK